MAALAVAIPEDDVLRAVTDGQTVVPVDDLLSLEEEVRPARGKAVGVEREALDVQLGHGEHSARMGGEEGLASVLDLAMIRLSNAWTFKEPLVAKFHAMGCVVP